MTDAFAADVRRGLTSSPKTIDPKFFYDPLGSALFAAICELPEYYVTRCEREIFERHAAEIAGAFGPIERLIELGSGNSRKTQLLLAHLPGIVYQPVDVDAQMLAATKRELESLYPALKVEPHAGDFADLTPLRHPAPTALLFLGSTIGNLDHEAATEMLRNIRAMLGEGDAALIGFDLQKPKPVIEAAYDDPLGVTAAFNLNVLARINRELGGTFVLDRFSHRAFYDDTKHRIEMHLVSKERQTVRIAALDLDIAFERDETIHTENSHKYDDREIRALAAEAGLNVERQWTDARGWFADVLMRAR